MNPELEEKLRRLNTDVLSVLSMLSVSEGVAFELENITAATYTAETDLRGIISTLRRTKIAGEPLILQAGRDTKGRFRWQINSKIIDKGVLADYLQKEILGKDFKWKRGN